MTAIREVGAKTLSEAKVKTQLDRAIQKAGSQREYARMHHISESHLSDSRRGRRALGPAVLRSLGLQRIVLYVPAKEPP